MSDLHLDSLEIKNFRCFEHLVIEKLGRVNLIVGRNSVGKTCLLEALQIYAVKAEPHTLQILLAQRDEFRMDREPVDQTDAERLALSFAEGIRNIFYDRNLTPGQTRITIGGKDKLSQIEFGLDAYAIETDHTGVTKGLRALKPDEYDLFENIKIRLTVDHNSNKKLITPLIRSAQFSKLFSKNIDLIPGIFIGTQGVDNNNLADLWEKITLTGLEEETNTALQIIDPSIERYTFIGEPPHRYPMIKHKSIETPIPLRSLGEGLARSLGIVLALVNAKDGFLLIDEFESGLHHRVQSDLWKIIFRLAKQLNLQVFATTHSWDCVKAFQEAAAEDQNEEAMLIRLERWKDKIEAVTYEEEDMKAAVNESIEVR